MTGPTDNLLAKSAENLRVLMAASRSYHGDPEFRAQLEAAPRAALAGMGLELGDPDLDGPEVRVRANTGDTFYLVMPADPNTPLSDEAMSGLAGGSTTSTVSTAGSGSTASTPVSSLSTLGSGGSAGTAGEN